MECNCKWTEIILGVIVIVFTFINWSSSKWIIFAAGVLLVLHAFMCKNCGMCREHAGSMKMKSKSPRRK